MGETKIGKPTGIDIKEQKMTLPLIYAINNVSKKDRNWLIHSVRKYNTDKKRVKKVIEFVKDSGGLEYAQKKMEAFQKDALDILMSLP
jgi:octaprenyl-diphosphate synthase